MKTTFITSFAFRLYAKVLEQHDPNPGVLDLMDRVAVFGETSNYALSCLARRLLCQRNLFAGETSRMASTLSSSDEVQINSFCSEIFAFVK
jgi:hypothetical protein